MRVLITGACGFAGRHLIADLIVGGHEPAAYDLAAPAPGVLPELTRVFQGDLLDAARLASVISEFRPDGCVHLAGIAHVPVGWARPELVFNVNLIGTLTLLEALRKAAPAARLLVVSSAEVYGRDLPPAPLDENAATDPDNPYGLSKLAAERISLMYFRRYSIPVLIARPCNHIGPGQSPDFVVPAFAEQLREIAVGTRPPVMKVGNLESQRVFLDVRDVTRAYRLLLERGAPGGIYNIAREDETSIGEVLDQLCRLAGTRPEIEINPALFRPTDRRPLLSSARIGRELGWHPAIELSETLRDIMAVERI